MYESNQRERSSGRAAASSKPAAKRPAGRAGSILRLLCYLTAAVNMGGNAALFLAHEWVFKLLGVPLPADPHTFLSVLGFSFTSGVLALLVAMRPERGVRLLVVGIVSKGLFALITLSVHVAQGVPWPWLVFALWDGVFTAIFWLYLIHLQRPELLQLNSGVIRAGTARPRTKRALLLSYSLSGNVGRAVKQVATGLEETGYEATCMTVHPVDRELFSFPFRSLMQFLRIAVRAILRRPAAIEPLPIGPDHDYDLIVVTAQTWMVGMAAPIEALFQDPDQRRIFSGRDVAIVNVCRGIWRRSQAQLASRVQAAGGNLVGASAHTNPGWEPARTISLFVFLAAGTENSPRWLRRLLQPQFLADRDLDKLQRFGLALGERPQAAGMTELAAAAERMAAVEAEDLRVPRAVTGEPDDDAVAEPEPAVAVVGERPWASSLADGSGPTSRSPLRLVADNELDSEDSLREANL